MKHSKKSMPLLLCLLFCFAISFGQTYKDDDTSDTAITTLQELQVLGIDNSPNPRSATLTGSSVFVRQIGEFNQANLRVSANASDINIQQNGDDNLAELEYQVNTAITNIQQNGNSNRIQDFVIDRTEDVSLDLVQEGNNMNFERSGSNALTRSLKFKQTTSYQTIIVRSFN